MADGGANHVNKVEEVIAAEREHLRRIRGWRFEGHGPDGPPTLGLALSGGGIRSAAFALGVMHALVRDGKLRWFDYLSTVSGGGYAGGALTWMLSTYAGADVDPSDAKGPGGFPLGGWRQGRRTTTRNTPAKFDARPYRRLDWIRLRANFLTPTDEFNARERTRERPAEPGAPEGTRDRTVAAPGRPRSPRHDQVPRGGLGVASLIGVVLRSVVIGLLTYLPAMLVLMLAVAALVEGLGSAITDWSPGWKTWAAPLTGTAWEGLFLLLGGAALAAFVVGCLLYALVTRVNRLWAYPMRTRVQWLGGHVLVVTAFGVVMGSLPYAPAGAKRLTAVFGLTAAGIAAGALRLLLRVPSGSKTAWSSGMIAIAGGLALCYGLLLGTHILSYALLDAMRALARPDGMVGLIHDHPALTVALMLAWAAFSGLALNLNYVTPHRMYRDRLMEAFMPPPSEARKGFEAHTPDRAPLADMCGAGAGNGKYPGPYHLINANVVLAGSRYEGARGRGGDSFLLSPLFCGAHRMGWYRTQKLGAARLAVNRWTMTLATAMSISGAAANPNTGAGGQGAQRLWPIAFLMTLLHLRLGYIETNPRWVDRLAGGWERWVVPARPNGWMPGLPHLLGLGHHEDAPFVELSDGGHFENLGLYELFRREARLIVCSDAGCDGEFAFFDLANAIERARVDFGVNIRFAGDRGLTALVLPKLPPGANAFLAAAAERGFAIARIRYAPTRRPAPPLDNEPIEPPAKASESEISPEIEGRTGILVYVKSTMLAGLPADLYGYRASFPDFPHQPTSDQNFDEPQFESYRELGYQLMSRALGDGIVRKVLGDPGEAVPVAGPDADRLIREAFELAERPDR